MRKIKQIRKGNRKIKQKRGGKKRRKKKREKGGGKIDKRGLRKEFSLE